MKASFVKNYRPPVRYRFLSKYGNGVTIWFWRNGPAFHIWETAKTPNRLIDRIWYERSGACHCGIEMERHGILENHSPVEMIRRRPMWDWLCPPTP